MKTFKVSETVTFTKVIKANNEDKATKIFISSMHNLVFGKDCKEFKDVSNGLTIKEIYL